MWNIYMYILYCVHIKMKNITCRLYIDKKAKKKFEYWHSYFGCFRNFLLYYVYIYKYKHTFKYNINK